jgi:hypothetical protein
MKTANFKEGMAFLATAAIIALTSFRNNDADTKRPSLQAINNQASTTLIAYNHQHTISKLTRIQKTVEETYTDVRIPVYENGHLVSTLVSAHENGEESEIFSSFDYAADYRQIEKIRYYVESQVQGYDSLVYNPAGQITARYFFSRTASNNFENHNYQAYTWDDAGNVRQLDNYGRTAASGNFALSTTITYTYDKKPNPHKYIDGLCYITDILPSFLSANNILSEQIINAETAGISTNTYTYEYNAAQYPTRVTAQYGPDGTHETTKLSYQ